MYGDQPVPQYKVNARSVDILHQLAECNETRDRDVSLLIDDVKQKTAEYELEGKLGTLGSDYRKWTYKVVNSL